VSVEGGRFPRWRRDGSELFFQALDQTLMAAETRSGAGFEVGVPKPLFKTTLVETSISGYKWDVAADGRRFLVNTPTASHGGGQFVVVENWVSELARKR
jgi:hypothetical protein